MAVHSKANDFTKTQIFLGLELTCAVACSKSTEKNIPWAEVCAPLCACHPRHWKWHFLRALNTEFGLVGSGLD